MLIEDTILIGPPKVRWHGARHGELAAVRVSLRVRVQDGEAPRSAGVARGRSGGRRGSREERGHLQPVPTQPQPVRRFPHARECVARRPVVVVVLRLRV